MVDTSEPMFLKSLSNMNNFLTDLSDGTPTGATTFGQSGHGSNDNEKGIPHELFLTDLFDS